MKNTVYSRSIAPTLGMILSCLAAFGATSISQFGIEWTFDRNYETGQFANGDFWVVGPVTIVSITPKDSDLLDGIAMHGSMTNPLIGLSHGFDSRISNSSYQAALNCSLRLPLTLPPHTSLLSSESYPTTATGNDVQLKTIAILTVLDAPAPAGSFRPPYVGNDKRLKWSRGQLDYTRLHKLPIPLETPSLSALEEKHKRPWIEINTTWSGRFWHPRDNQPDYGREIANCLAVSMLALQLDFTDQQKENLLTSIVQYGIDIFGAAKAGGVWVADGGHNQGRKMPLLLASVVLGDREMEGYADASKHFIFQEDRQIFRVSEVDVGRVLYTADGRVREPYTSEDVGLAEWGEKHFEAPHRDGRNWDIFYRDIAGSSTIGHVLTARLMNLKQNWNRPVLFDYYDRFWEREQAFIGAGVNRIQPFIGRMWANYRLSAAVGSEQPVAPANVRALQE